MKGIVGLGLGIFCLSSAVFLIPSKTKMVGAYYENLWTSPGTWSLPTSNQQVLEWSRTEWGLPFAWVVHDSCITENAWYTKVDTEPLILYLVVSTCLALVCVAIGRKLAESKD